MSMSTFKLDPAEVSYTGSSTHRGHRKKMRCSRAMMLSGAEIVLQHRPTGVEVRGALPTGHYSRKEMRQLQQQLYEELYTVLEQAVARILRIPGQ
jgi:hypothetical protein